MSSHFDPVSFDAVSESHPTSGLFDGDLSQRQATIALTVILVVAGAVFSQAIAYGIIPSWDDGAFVVNRPEIQHWWSATWRQRLLTPEIGYPLPVPTFIYAHVEWLFGKQAFHVLHALSIALHLGNVVLVYALVRRWFDRRMGVVVAGLWSVHPLVVETAVWLTDLKMVLAGTFILAAMLVWQRAVLQRDDESPPWRGYVAVAVLFVLAGGCRPDAAVLPVVLALQCATTDAPLASLRRHGRTLAGLLVLAAMLVVSSELSHSGIVKTSVFHEDGPVAVVARVFHALQLSAGHLLWPVDLQPGYFQDFGEGLLDSLGGIAVLVALVGIIGALVARHKTRVAFAWVLAGVFYAPFSNLLFLPRFTADTYLYLVSFATLCGLAALARLGLGQIEDTERARSTRLVAGVVAAVVFVGFGTLTFRQVRRWQNGITLWQPVMDEQPRVPRPYFHVGYEYARREQWKAARDVLMKGYTVLRASRDIPEFMPTVLLNTGEPERAADVALQALMVNPKPDPKLNKVLLETLVSHKLALPDAPEALAQIRKSIAAYLNHAKWADQKNVGTGFGAYFINQGHPELAVPFVDLALHRKHPHCVAWKLHAALPVALQTEDPAPEAPTRCH